MYYKSIFSALFLLVSLKGQGQKSVADKIFHRAVFAEIGGVGGIYSVNYEMNVAVPKFKMLNFSIATGFCQIKSNELYWKSIPIRLKTGLKYRRCLVDFGYNKILTGSDPEYSFSLSQMIPLVFYSFGLSYDCSKRYFLGIDFFKISRYNQDNDYFLKTLKKDLYNGQKAYWWGGVRLGYRF